MSFLQSAVNGIPITSAAFDGGEITNRLIVPQSDLSDYSIAFSGDLDTGIRWRAANVMELMAGGSASLTIRSGNTVSIGGLVNAPTWSSGNGNGIHFNSNEGLEWADALNSANSDARFERISAGVIGQLDPDGSAAQELQIYGTRTDASNYERFVVRSAAGTYTIGTEAAGTGTLQEWNLVGADIGIGQSAPKQKLDVNGQINATLGFVLSDAANALSFGMSGSGSNMFLRVGAASAIQLGDSSGGIFLHSKKTGTAIGKTTPTGRLSIAEETEAVASLNIQVTREVHTLAAAATSDTTLAIPSGAMLLGVGFNVDTAVVDDGGDDTWSAAFITGSTATLATAAAAAQNTKVDTLIVPEIASATTEVRFTANGGNFSAGVIETLVYYVDLTSLANA